MTIFQTKLRSGSRLIDATIEVHGGRMWFNYGFAKQLTEEIKIRFEGRKWHGFEEPPIKKWSAPLTQRNLFQLEYLRDKYGALPYARYDAEIPQTTIDRSRAYFIGRGINPYDAQALGTAHILTRRHSILAYEMGLGKTLMAMMATEMENYKDVFWVAPKSALRSADAEFDKWNARFTPKFYNYAELKRIVENWKGDKAPEVVIFDECQKIKTHTSQRSVAAKHIADAMRVDRTVDGSLLVLMSGTPAPKSPLDWWHLCETACPGFLREGSLPAFRDRLGLIQERENVQGGGVYPHLVTWLDDANKCAVCGQLEKHPFHNKPKDPKLAALIDDNNPDNFHTYKKSKNEVAELYKRMNGLVLVKHKRDVLDLPEKYYEIARAEPTKEIKRAAQLITAKSVRAIEALTLLRELSDGFQYRDEVDGKEQCPLCKGTLVETQWYDPDDPDGYTDPVAVEQGERWTYDDDGIVVHRVPITYLSRSIQCTKCFGTGIVDRYIRSYVELPTPKEGMLEDELELHEDVGRLTVYAGFQASIDRVIRICHKNKWTTIRADGRGWEGLTPTGDRLPDKELLKIFDRGHSEHPRVVFCGQPGAAGMGLTLTASPSIVFFSNTFNGEDRMQAEDRGHRIGMNKERGGRIVDFFHLDTDEYVLNNLREKKDLQHMSMTGLLKAIKEQENADDRKSVRE
jgi:hypothetical protein